ncbi:MAG: hypothetical protein ACR2M0_11810 [Chloroflexia bacterium]
MVENRVTVTATPAFNPSRAAGLGVVAGILGGIVFGLWMTILIPPALPKIGTVIGMGTLGGGWLYHLFNSAVIGAIFGLVLGRVSTTYSLGALWGAIYGFVWWILGPLVLLPILLGMPSKMFMLDDTSLTNLVGHVVFGVITGLVYVLLKDRMTARA